MGTTALLLGILLATASGAGWASLDSVRKHLSGSLSPLAILLGLSIAQLPVHATGLALSGWPGWSPGPFLAWSLLAAGVAVLANLLLIRAVATSPLSLVVPMLSFTPAFTLLTGWLLLDQRPGPLAGVGMALVVGGALTLDAAPGALLRDPLRTLRSPGSRLALSVALLFSLGNAIDRRTIVHGNEPLYALTLTLMIVASISLLPGPRRELLASRDRRGLLAAGGAIMGAALILQLFAFRFLPVATVDAAKRTAANATSAVLGRVLFQERDAWRRGAAGLVMSAGVILLLLG